ncbi:hypothetical protein BDR22DRAFT_704146 [Usnea florida]
MMNKYAQPHATNCEDFYGVGTSDVYDDGNDVRRAFWDVPAGHDALPSVNTPSLSYGGTPSSPLIESLNGQVPIHDFDFNQPSPKIYGSTHEQLPKNNKHSHGRTNREARYGQQQSNGYQKHPEQCRSEKKDLSIRLFQCLKDRSIQLFQCLKDLNKDDEAEELYHEIIKEYDVGEKLQDVTEKGREHGTNDGSKILGLKHTFAEMLIAQQRFAEAEPVSRAVWEKMEHCPGTPPEDFQKSHRQLCSVLRALGAFKDAERMHNDMYQREPKDEWALENGDEMCQTLKEQTEFRKAKDLQEEVLKKRLEKPSRRELTIQSGVRLIEFLDEELNKPVDYESGTEAEKGFASSTRQALKYKLEMTLWKVWHMRLQPEPNANILDVGHKLGFHLLQDNKFLDAEGVLRIVWENKKRELGIKNDSTMSSGSLLGSTMWHQGTEESYSKAVDILGPIWLLWQSGTGNCDAQAISSIKHLAQAYCSLGNLQGGECVYDWICHQMQQDGYSLLDRMKGRWDLGVTLHKQGKDKNQKAALVLEEVYKLWNTESHNPDETLKCGQILAQSLSTQEGKTDKALNVAQGVFEKREVLEKRGVDYLESAQLYGSLLLKAERYEVAESVLRSAWECQPGNPEEQKLRLKCGPLYGQALYGQALAGRHKYAAVKKVLETVAEDQKGILPTGCSELTETRRLLEDVVRQEKARKKGRPKARPKGRFV